MKKNFALVFCVLLAVVMFACGQQEAESTDTGAAGQPEEVADTTRLDSAAVEDTTAAMPDDTLATEESTGQ